MVFLTAQGLQLLISSEINPLPAYAQAQGFIDTGRVVDVSAFGNPTSSSYVLDSSLRYRLVAEGSVVVDWEDGRIRGRGDADFQYNEQGGVSDTACGSNPGIRIDYGQGLREVEWLSLATNRHEYNPSHTYYFDIGNGNDRPLTVKYWDCNDGTYDDNSNESLKVRIYAEASYTLSVSPSFAQINAGESREFEISMRSATGNIRSVALTCTIASAGQALCQPAQTTVYPDDPARITIATDASMQPGTYTATITGEAAGITWPVDIKLQVNRVTPNEDMDSDGIPNDLDQCDEAPETRNGYQDEDGCPDESPDPDPDSGNTTALLVALIGASAVIIAAVIGIIRRRNS
jgi:hypothetical protein